MSLESVKRLRKWFIDGCHIGVDDTQIAMTVNDLADEIELEIDANYLELPKDAEGMPVHVGDKMCGFVDTIETVAGVSEKAYFTRDSHGDYDWHTAKDRYHAKPDPLKQLLREFGYKVAQQSTEDDREINEMTDEYAKLIRKLGIRGLSTRELGVTRDPRLV